MLSFFQRDVLDEIWDLIESVSEGFPSYSYDFYAPPQKVAGYNVIPSELLSVRPSVRPSAVEHSCPVHNFDTVRDNFTKLGTNVKHDQTTCRD